MSNPEYCSSCVRFHEPGDCDTSKTEASSSSPGSDPWYELLCELDEIREYLDHRGASKWAATIGDVQARLTRQKETIEDLDQNSGLGSNKAGVSPER